MFDATSQDVLSDPQAALGALREFVGLHRDALLDAALLLGGGPGLRVAQTALDGLQGPRPPSRRTMRDLDRLLGLLRLENVHREGTIEAERFALIDPTDPCVEELCLLADQVSEFLGTYRAARMTASEIGPRAAA
jgi:hypothetical protein